MLSPSDIQSLRNEFLLTPRQIEQFESMLKRVENHISTVELLKIYSEYGFNQQLLEDHVDLFIKRRLTESAFKKIHKQVLDSQSIAKEKNVREKEKERQRGDDKSEITQKQQQTKGSAETTVSKSKNIIQLEKHKLQEGRWKVSYSLNPDGSVTNFVKVPI